MVRSFPDLGTSAPSIIYYRHPSGGANTHVSASLRRHLQSRGYETSPHWETTAWGEHTLAWRADRCRLPGMPGTPLWWNKPSTDTKLGHTNTTRAS
eukprot:scaffold289397_cov30-Tisochrysis_lutea.AAC.8